MSHLAPNPRNHFVSHALILVLGAICLAYGLRQERGSLAFYLGTLALCMVWLVGGFLLRPRDAWPASPTRPGLPSSLAHPIRPARSTRPAFAAPKRTLTRLHIHQPTTPTQRWLWGIGAGIALATLFLAGGFAVQFIPALVNPVNNLLSHSLGGNLGAVTAITALGGFSEEYYFRRALFYETQSPRLRLLIPAAAYVLVTAVSGIVLLTFAALLVGLVTGALTLVTDRLYPAVTAHLLWSLAMLYLLPPITAGWMPLS